MPGEREMELYADQESCLAQFQGSRAQEVRFMVNRSKFLRCALISCPQVTVDSGEQQALEAV